MDESSVAGAITIGAETNSVEDDEPFDPKNFLFKKIERRLEESFIVSKSMKFALYFTRKVIKNTLYDAGVKRFKMLIHYQD